jgi:hypothetical protein
MVLCAVTGELGTGKTLFASYLVWNNFFYKKRKIATNYTIYGIPFCRIRTLEQFFKFIPEKETEEEILRGEEKAFFGDDFWRFISSRMIGMGAKQKNEMINRILMASRKAFVTVYFTTQLFSMIDKNIREITDLLFKPTLGGNMQYCKAYVYGVIEGKLLQPMQPIYFWTEPIFAIYNTFERAGDIDIESPDSELVEEFHPIEENPAWKRYCMVNLGMDINSEEYLRKCKEVEEGLGLSEVRKKYERKA